MVLEKNLISTKTFFIEVEYKRKGKGEGGEGGKWGDWGIGGDSILQFLKLIP